MSANRRQKLVPWYHVPKPRCVTITLAKTQCTFSAVYTDENGRILVCKAHGDMLILDGVKLSLLRERYINLHEERPPERPAAQAVKFQSA